MRQGQTEEIKERAREIEKYLDEVEVLQYPLFARAVQSSAVSSLERSVSFTTICCRCCSAAAEVFAEASHLCRVLGQGKSWTATEEPQKGASKKKPKKIKKTETIVKVNTSEPEGAGAGSAAWSGWCVMLVGWCRVR